MSGYVWVIGFVIEGHVVVTCAHTRSRALAVHTPERYPMFPIITHYPLLIQNDQIPSFAASHLVLSHASMWLMARATSHVTVS